MNEDFKGPSPKSSEVKKQNWMDNSNNEFRKSNQNYSDLGETMKEEQKRGNVHKEDRKRVIKEKTVIDTGNESWISVSAKTRVDNDFSKV